MWGEGLLVFQRSRYMLHGQASATTFSSFVCSWLLWSYPIATFNNENKHRTPRNAREKKQKRQAHHQMPTCWGIMVGKHDTLTCFLNHVFPYPIKLYNVPKICIAPVASLFLDFLINFKSRKFILNYWKVMLQCSSSSRSSFNVLILLHHSTTKSELLSLVLFFGPLEEDGASFGVASKATRANKVEDLEQEAKL